MRSRSCFFKKLVTISAPNIQLTPLSLSPQPWKSFSGSLHSKSHKIPNYKFDCIPVSGISTGLLTFQIQSSQFKSGLSPPCIQMILSSMIDNMVRLLKQSPNNFQSLMLYLLLLSSQNPYSLFMVEHSWFPLNKKKFSGYLILQARSRHIVSIENLPLSTQSPKNRQLASGGNPPSSKILNKSQYCPCMSPCIYIKDTADLDRGFEFQHYWLAHKNLD